jgi:membrane protease YdiL (CAAX protease family)
MDTVNKPRISLTIIGIMFTVSFTFILLYAESFFPGFLRYGYAKKFIIWLWLLLLVLYTVKVEKQRFILWKDSKRSFLFYVLSVIAIMALSFLAGASRQLLPLFGVKLQSSQVLKEMIMYVQQRPLLLVLTCITAGVVEELIFRAYLIPRLTLLLKTNWLPLLLSAFVFGLAHIGYGTFVNMLVPFLLGVIFGAYYQKYRNIKVLICCHFLIDLISLLVQK